MGIGEVRNDVGKASIHCHQFLFIQSSLIDVAENVSKASQFMERRNIFRLQQCRADVRNIKSHPVDQIMMPTILIYAVFKEFGDSQEVILHEVVSIMDGITQGGPVEFIGFNLLDLPGQEAVLVQKIPQEINIRFQFGEENMMPDYAS